MKLHITRAGRKHALAVAQRNYSHALNAAYEHSHDQDSGDVTADTEEPQARSSSVTEHSLSSSCAPLNHGPASQSDHARSSSLTDSADGLGPVAYGPVIEISRDVSILRDWDIYAKRNDLTL